MLGSRGDQAGLVHKYQEEIPGIEQESAANRLTRFQILLPLIFTQRSSAFSLQRAQERFLLSRLRIYTNIKNCIK